MKKVFFLFFLFFFLSVSFVRAESASGSAVGMTQSVDYSLPYPGILPDNPFYFLKASRDKIISFLIVDPLKKASFNLLQADKRLQAGVYLIKKDKKNVPLALSTILKGENYFDDAIAKVEEAKKQGVVITDIASKMTLSARKHQEVLTSLKKAIPEDQQATYEVTLKRMKSYQSTLEQLQKGSS